MNNYRETEIENNNKDSNNLTSSNNNNNNNIRRKKALIKQTDELSTDKRNISKSNNNSNSSNKMFNSSEHKNGKKSQVKTANNNNSNSNKNSLDRSNNERDHPEQQLISDAATTTTTTKLTIQMKAEMKVRADETTTTPIATIATIANKMSANVMEKALRESLAASHVDTVERESNEIENVNNNNNNFRVNNAKTEELHLNTSKMKAKKELSLEDTQGAENDDGGGGGGGAAASELKLSNALIETVAAKTTTKSSALQNTESEKTPANDVYQSSIATDSATTTLLKPDADLRFGCAHYKRRAMFVTPCCNKFYKCRFCHDENESHHFDRKTLTELICSECNRRQKVQEQCEACGTRFGKYTCLICNLFDDTDKQQYHCNGCGICRIGGAENFFHCEVCDMCLPIRLKIDGHRCVENISRSHCPVCLGDIHTSRIPCHIPDCGHLLHKTCFDQLLNSGHYTCPICQTSLIDMTALWEYLDTQAVSLPVPKKYENQRMQIFCNDCHKTSKTKFNLIGLKCLQCGAYNTTQDMKRRMSLVVDEPSSA